MMQVLSRSSTKLASVAAIALLLMGGVIWWGNIQGGSPVSAGHLEAGVVLIALNEQNGSGQSGSATLTALGNDTEIVLSLSEGTLDSKVAHIHIGQCDPGLGVTLYGLTNLTNGKSTTVLKGVSLIGLLTGNVGINTHNAEDQSIATSCGSIPADGGFVTVALSEEDNSGQAGWATLTARGNDTELVMSLSSGEIESRVAHIHLGRCGPGLGATVSGLTNLVDGVSITLVKDTTLDSLLASDLGINTHNLEDSSIVTACGDIPAKAETQFYFTVVAINQATVAGEEHRLILDGHGQFNPEVAIGGGSFVHYKESGITPKPILASGTWRATDLVKWTPHGGSYAGITPGVLDIQIELVPENGPAITGVSLRIICNVGPAGIFNLDPETGSALPEGFILTFPDLSFYPNPLGPFEPIIFEGGLPFGLTTIGRVQTTE